MRSRRYPINPWPQLFSAASTVDGVGAWVPTWFDLADLKNLAGVQEMYFDEQERYTDDLAALRYMSSDGVTIRLEADPDS